MTIDKVSNCAFHDLERERLISLLNNLSSTRIGVFGDVALDIYWDVDMTRSRLSRETPHYPYPVVREGISLGAGGNVVANLLSLGVGKVELMTCIGEDWRGLMLQKVAKELGVGVDSTMSFPKRITPAFCKPILNGISDVRHEVNRVDFQNISELTEDLESAILQKLPGFLKQVDAVVVSDQLPHGMVTRKIRERICRKETSIGKYIVVDSRDNVSEFSGVILKPNQYEAVRAVFPNADPRVSTVDDWIAAGITLQEKTRSSILMTLGEEGAYWFEAKKDIVAVPSVPATGPLDTVGAGDTFVSAFISTLLAGATTVEALIIANIAAAIVVRKLWETGTATPDEVVEQYDRLTGGR